MQRIPVFLSSDNKYAPFVATTMVSILSNTKSFIEFYILDGGITKENQDKICEVKNRFDNFSIEFLRIDLDKYFSNFPETENITKAMYSRFLIPELKPEIDKAIYTDVDVIFLDDIGKMYNEDLGAYALGAIWEEYAEKTVNKERKERLRLSNKHKFFSSGNLLIDCKKWREDNIFENVLNIAAQIELKEPDMDILNKYFDNNYKVLSPKYCWINQNYEFFGQPKEQIVIRHFNGPVKPWHISPNISENTKLTFSLDKDKFWYYAEMTSFYDELIKNIIYSTNKDMIKFLVEKMIRDKAKNV